MKKVFLCSKRSEKIVLRHQASSYEEEEKKNKKWVKRKMKKNICEQILYVLSDIKQNRKNEKNEKHKT